MRLITRLAAAACAAAVIAATPAAAQYYPDPDERDTVEEVVDGVARVAGAVVAATQGYDPYDRRRYGYGYGQGAERHAADSCAYEAQRRLGRRYGRVDVDIRDVRWDRRDRLRVFGAADLRRGYNRYDRDDRYDRYDRYDRFDRDDRRYRDRIAFSCTVRPDGRVTDFDTHNYDW